MSDEKALLSNKNSRHNLTIKMEFLPEDSKISFDNLLGQSGAPHLNSSLIKTEVFIKEENDCSFDTVHHPESLPQVQNETFFTVDIDAKQKLEDLSSSTTQQKELDSANLPNSSRSQQKTLNDDVPSNYETDHKKSKKFAKVPVADRSAKYISQQDVQGLKCVFCDYQSPCTSDLVRHIRIHTGEKPYQCDICDFNSARKSGLKRHIMRTHTEDKLFKCKKCESYCGSQSSLKEHMLTHGFTESAKCSLCKKISNPAFTKRNNADTEYKCDKCNYSCFRKRYSQKKIKTHIDAKPFLCKICGSKYDRKNKLEIHMRRHTGEKPFQCDHCNYKAVRQYDITSHTRSRHFSDSNKPFKCETCNYTAVLKSALRAHTKTHTGEKPFKCGVCPYGTEIKNNLTLHLRTHTGKRPYKCDICCYSAAVKSSLETHVSTHSLTREFICEECDCGFSSMCYLLAHKLLHTKKVFKCGDCTYSFRHKSNLINHTKVHIHLKDV